jgi:D-alanyl-D-alanine carboxypeptidase
VLLILGVLGLAGGQAHATVTPPPAVASPAASDASELAKRLDAYFEPLAGTADLSGILHIKRDGAPALVRRYGYADWPRRMPHTDDTRYSAASVTKGILAATLVVLSREGVVSLDDPVGRWLPALHAHPDMTLRAVLRHRAGLPRELPGNVDSARDGVAAWLANHPDVMAPPGEERYSNVGYALLAEVVEAATGSTFAEVARQRVLVPIGMHDSVIRLQTAKDVPGGALPYTAGPEPSGVMTPVPAALEIGSSGLITTVADLAAWVRALAGGRYPELFDGDDPLGSIDAGSDGNGPYVAVQGTLPGYVANAITWPGRGLTVSFTGNLFSYPALDLGDVLRALLGPEPPAPPTSRPTAVPLADEHLALVGEHRHPDFGPIVIALATAGDRLVLTLPGKPAYWSFHLTPIADGALHWRAFDRVLRSDGAGGLAE